MTDKRRSALQTSSFAPHSLAEQLRQTNRRLAVVNQELEETTEQLRAAQAHLRTYQDQLRRYATDLRQSEETVDRLHTELTLLNAGLVDTIADNLQATEFARVEAEAQRQRLHRLLAEAPAMIAVLAGPDHVVELANDHFRALLGSRELVGQPFCQAVPELAGQPFLKQLAEVYRTGETYTATDAPLTLNCPPAGQPAQLVITYVLQATRDEAGHLEGLVVFAQEVTEPVRAH